jgi:hypothetical protein
LAASSTDRRNTGVESLCWSFKLQGLSRSLIELTRHFVEMGLRVHREVSSLRKVLSQQTIGVLIGSALPWTLRIAAHTAGFGGDDFLPSAATAGASPPASQVAENSVNLGFLMNAFGPLATSTIAGTQYDIVLQATDHGHALGAVHDGIILV